MKTTEAREETTEQSPSEADVRLGRRIRALRLERKLGIAEVAQRAGISVGALSQIERGISSLRIRVLWPLAAALGVEPHSLLADDEGEAAIFTSCALRGEKTYPFIQKVFARSCCRRRAPC